MKTSTQILPGIRRIGYLKAALLPRAVALHGICGTPVPILTEIVWTDFFDSPDCRCRTEKSGGGYSSTATLKFHSSELIPFCDGLGFVVEDVTGTHYLIGAQEPPLPKIAVEQICGAPDGDGAGFKYDITHTAVRTMVPCIVSA